ncbi:MAG TPA: hypothetical protein VGM37_16585 [Armatimonadota bacterium]|jgi:hypothetical protein
MRMVHRFDKLVRCPVCRDLYMREDEESCWRCSPPEIPTGERRAVTRAVRNETEAEEGSVGSLVGLGFAPLDEEPAR